MIYQNLAILAFLAFFYSVISGWLEKTPINGAFVYTAFGLLLGNTGLGLLGFEINEEGLRVIAEITLAVVLFSDAANSDFSVLKKNLGYPKRLLLIGLPLTILLGFIAGAILFSDLSWIALAVLATMLAPTDAALGKAVVSDEAVPAPIRQSLNMESGLNDGICVPVLFAFLAIASGDENGNGLLMHLMIEEIGIGMLCGLAFTSVGCFLLNVAYRYGWLNESWRQLPVVTLAVLCFTSAQLAGGSGFIAAFAGGMLFGWLARRHKEELLVSAEATGDTLAMVTWVIFGAAVVGPSLSSFTPVVLVYSLVSLTLVRMLPVFICLHGTQLSAADKLFIGWFGPRGLASIVFGVIVLGEHLPGGDTISTTMICTVLLSVILHGVSANPLVKALARRP
ncbi:cation:proton antiporter [Desulforhopalus sp. 52FAK]